MLFLRLQTSGSLSFRRQTADFRRFLLEIPAFGGHKKTQKTTDFCRKPKIFAEKCRKTQIGLRHLRSVTFSLALKNFGLKNIGLIFSGEVFFTYSWMFCLQSNFCAYSPFRRFLDAFSHCKQKTPSVSKKPKV